MSFFFHCKTDPETTSLTFLLWNLTSPERAPPPKPWRGHGKEMICFLSFLSRLLVVLHFEPLPCSLIAKKTFSQQHTFSPPRTFTPGTSSDTRSRTTTPPRVGVSLPCAHWFPNLSGPFDRAFECRVITGSDDQKSTVWVAIQPISVDTDPETVPFVLLPQNGPRSTSACFASPAWHPDHNYPFPGHRVPCSLRRRINGNVHPEAAHRAAPPCLAPGQPRRRPKHGAVLAGILARPTRPNRVGLAHAPAQRFGPPPRPFPFATSRQRTAAPKWPPARPRPCPRCATPPAWVGGRVRHKAAVRVGWSSHPNLPAGLVTPAATLALSVGSRTVVV